jgi:hypothetical protein
MLGSVYFLFMGLTLPFPLPQQSIPVGIFIVAFFLEGVFGQYPEAGLNGFRY